MKNTNEPVGLIEGLTIAGLLVGFECENADKKTRWYRELKEIELLLKNLKVFLGNEGIAMTSDMNFFSRTKAPGLQAPAQPELPDNVKTMLEQLAAGLAALKERLAVLESRLSKLEGGQAEEKRIKANGHIRSFQQDITTHSRQVKR